MTGCIGKSAETANNCETGRHLLIQRTMKLGGDNERSSLKKGKGKCCMN